MQERHGMLHFGMAKFISLLFIIHNIFIVICYHTIIPIRCLCMKCTSSGRCVGITWCRGVVPR